MDVYSPMWWFWFDPSPTAGTFNKFAHDRAIENPVVDRLDDAAVPIHLESRHGNFRCPRQGLVTRKMIRMAATVLPSWANH